MSKVLEYIAPPNSRQAGPLDEDHDVTTLEWSADGSLLATGTLPLNASSRRLKKKSFFFFLFPST